LLSVIRCHSGSLEADATNRRIEFD
jgi:hypothetical protein